MCRHAQTKQQERGTSGQGLRSQSQISGKFQDCSRREPRLSLPQDDRHHCCLNYPGRALQATHFIHDVGAATLAEGPDANTATSSSDICALLGSRDGLVIWAVRARSRHTARSWSRAVRYSRPSAVPTKTQPPTKQIRSLSSLVVHLRGQELSLRSSSGKYWGKQPKTAEEHELVAYQQALCHIAVPPVSSEEPSPRQASPWNDGTPRSKLSADGKRRDSKGGPSVQGLQPCNPGILALKKDFSGSTLIATRKATTACLRTKPQPQP